MIQRRLETAPVNRSRPRASTSRLVGIHTRPDEEEVPTVRREGLALTAPARTLVDVAGEIQPEHRDMAVSQALARGLLTVRRLDEEARRPGRPVAVSAALTAVTWVEAARTGNLVRSARPRSNRPIDP